MSAPRRFRATLMVGRGLQLTLDARDEQAAEDIATWLFHQFGDRHFTGEPEAIFDCIVDPLTEEAAS